MAALMTGDAQEVLAFATQDGASRPRMLDEAGPSRQMEEEQQAEDEKFVHQMEQALELSWCRSVSRCSAAATPLMCGHTVAVCCDLVDSNFSCAGTHLHSAMIE